MLVGVSAGQIGRAKPRYVGLHDGYLVGLIRAGATPVVWPSTLGVGEPEEVAERAKELVGRVGGVVLSGGGDVDPGRYGATASTERLYGVDPARDAFELAVLKAAREAGCPVLAICRGAQVANVAFGGTLLQDVEEAGFAAHSDPDHEYEVSHEVVVEPGSLLERLVGHESYGVNSLHHQAVATLGAGLEVLARSPDGLVEAFAAPGLLALQWHPERMLESDPLAQRFFDWLVNGGEA